MKKRLFVIVDMVNGFVHFGALHDPYINHITPEIKKLAFMFLEMGSDVLAFRDCHQMGDLEFETYPVHCLIDTKESELIPELKPLENQMIVIPKNTTNGFLEEAFQEFYKEHSHEYEEIVVAGCCTDICVADFTTSLSRFHQEQGISIPIIVPKNLVETFDGNGHNREIYNEIGFERMRTAGVELVDDYHDYLKEKSGKQKVMKSYCNGLSKKKESN